MSAEFATTLDIRQIAPHQRHPMIFNSFETLEPGQSLQLINDHDPKPLYDQFQMKSGDAFSWTYLEAGPEVWRVQIGKAAAATSDCCSGGACCS